MDKAKAYDEINENGRLLTKLLMAVHRVMEKHGMDVYSPGVIWSPKGLRLTLRDANNGSAMVGELVIKAGSEVVEVWSPEGRMIEAVGRSVALEEMTRLFAK